MRSLCGAAENMMFADSIPIRGMHYERGVRRAFILDHQGSSRIDNPAECGIQYKVERQNKLKCLLTS